MPHDVAGSGPAVLLLHAGVCDRRMWDRQMETFAPAHRVIRCDLPGYGDLPLGEGPYSYSDEVVALLDELGVERAALVGCSLGGRVAVDVCLAAPERVSALVLVAPGRPDWEWSETARESWRRQEEAFTTSRTARSGTLVCARSSAWLSKQVRYASSPSTKPWPE